MLEFFQKLIDIIHTPGTYLAIASEHLNNFNFDENIITNYLGYIHYVMGTPLYITFTVSVIIGIAVNLYQIVTKLVQRFMEICGR